jgi:hypothetical protein
MGPSSPCVRSSPSGAAREAVAVPSVKCFENALSDPKWQFSFALAVALFPLCHPSSLLRLRQEALPHCCLPYPRPEHAVAVVALQRRDGPGQSDLTMGESVIKYKSPL